MADEPEVIKHRMEEQRASLADKLEALENRIVRTVDGAREAVADTVETVKDSVHTSVESVRDTVSSSVESVKETFDLPAQTRRHPWALFGGAVAAGFAGGWVLFRALEANRRPALPPASAYQPAAYTGSAAWMSRPQAAYSNGAASEPAPAPPPPPAPPAESGPSWISELGHKFEPELNKLKGLAIGALTGVVRDMITKSLPEQARPQVKDMIDNVTTKLGGEPIEGEVLQQFMPDLHRTEHRSGGLYESEAEAVNS